MLNAVKLTPSDGLSSIECDIKTIKRYVQEIATTYLLIAYRIYELNNNESYQKKGYRNIVDFCNSEFGFKKSTAYNFLNIVQTFGRDEKGHISYQKLMRVSDYSYSSLTEMLSLSDKQRDKVTPSMTVKQIRDLKSESFQTSGKSDIIDVDTYVISESGIEEISSDFPCDNCLYDIHGCCEYPDSPDDYCVMGDKFLPVPELGSTSVAPDEPVEIKKIQTSGKLISLEMGVDDFKSLRRFLNFCNDDKYLVDYELIQGISERIRELLEQERKPL